MGEGEATGAGYPVRSSSRWSPVKWGRRSCGNGSWFSAQRSGPWVVMLRPYPGQTHPPRAISPWWNGVPRQSGVSGERISLTFRHLLRPPW